MKNSTQRTNSHFGIIVTLAILAVATLPLLTNARMRPASINVNIMNNSNWEIRHVFLQASDQDPWSENQLNDSAIAPGGSATVSNAACDGAATKVITEDKDGCFLYKTVSCGDNATWTITSVATPDCGN